MFTNFPCSTTPFNGMWGQNTNFFGGNCAPQSNWTPGNWNASTPWSGIPSYFGGIFNSFMNGWNNPIGSSFGYEFPGFTPWNTYGFNQFASPSFSSQYPNPWMYAGMSPTFGAWNSFPGFSAQGCTGQFPGFQNTGKSNFNPTSTVNPFVGGPFNWSTGYGWNPSFNAFPSNFGAMPISGIPFGGWNPAFYGWNNMPFSGFQGQNQSSPTGYVPQQNPGFNPSVCREAA